MRRIAMLLTILLFLTGCGGKQSDGKIVLEHAFLGTVREFSEEIYPRYLSEDAVMGIGGGGIEWYDGEYHTCEAWNAAAYCVIPDGAAIVEVQRDNGETNPVIRFIRNGEEVSYPIVFGSFTTNEIGGTVPEYLELYPTETGAALVTSGEVIAVDYDGAVRRESYAQLIGVTRCPDGVCVFVYDELADRHVYLLNGEGGLDEVPLNLPDKAMNGIFLQNGDGFYADDTGIFAMNGDCIMDFGESGWLPEGIEQIRMHSEESFTFLGTHAGSGEYGVYDMKKSTGTVERILVEAVYDEYAGRQIPEAAAMFNASGDEYYVRCTMLEEPEGSLSGLDRVLLQEDIPDLAVLDNGTALDDYISRGVFLDQAEYFPEGSLMNCVRAALETDGKLFAVTPGFMVHTLCGKAEYLPENWTYDDFFRLQESLWENQTVFRGGRYGDALLYGAGSLMNEGNTDTSVLAKLYALMCFEPSAPMHTGKIGTEPYINGEILLANGFVNSVDTYVQMKAYAGWEEPEITGYPSADGGVHRIECDSRIVLFAACDSAQGAAAFIHYLVHTYPVTEAGRDFCSIPASSSCWDGWIGLLQASGMIFGFEPGEADWMPWNENSGQIAVVPDDALCDEFHRWLNGIRPASVLPDQVWDILTEELSACRGGSVSPEEAAERAAGRIRLYFSEKS